MKPRHSLKDFGDLHQVFDYRDGKLYWKEVPEEYFKTPRAMKNFNARFCGTRAGRVKEGYRVVGLLGKSLKEHRVIYYMFTGEEPEYIDHMDGNPLNNRIENLRPATNQQNIANAKMRCDNTSGVKGVSWHKQKQKWRASVRFNGKSIHIGLFDNLQDAKRARELKALELFGNYIDHDR